MLGGHRLGAAHELPGMVNAHSLLSHIFRLHFFLACKLTANARLYVPGFWYDNDVSRRLNRTLIELSQHVNQELD